MVLVFLGYHCFHEFLKDGYEVVRLSLPPMPAENLFPDFVENLLGDISSYTDDEVLSLMTGCDVVVYAIGADERWLADAPAYKSFMKLMYFQHNELHV